MSKTTRRVVQDDIEQSIHAARSLFDAAAATPIAGKAMELRSQAMTALDGVSTKLDDMEASFLGTYADSVETVDAYVLENPWRATLAAASVGILAGFMIAKI